MSCALTYGRQTHKQVTILMRRIAAPMIGGIFTSFIMELVVYPAIYAIWKWGWEVKPGLAAAGQ